MNKKFIRVLGFGVGLFLAGSLSVNAQKVSFNGERLSLKQAFEKIESVSKYKIAYNTSQLDVNKQVVQNGAAFIFACYGAGCGGFSVTAISCRCVKKKEELCSSSLPVVADWL